jgi:hypothetical protein
VSTGVFERENGGVLRGFSVRFGADFGRNGWRGAEKVLENRSIFCGDSQSAPQGLITH